LVFEYLFVPGSIECCFTKVITSQLRIAEVNTFTRLLADYFIEFSKLHGLPSTRRARAATLAEAMEGDTSHYRGEPGTWGLTSSSSTIAVSEFDILL
jgi:hypothetical protein